VIADLRHRTANRLREYLDPERNLGPPPRPQLAAGEEPAPPGYVGIGTMKTGTTWWSRLIARHPGVRRAVRKELHYFDVFSDSSFTDADRARYWSYFAQPADGPRVLRGEWTPRYASDFWTPPLLQRVAPEAKLLMLVRDPIQRYVSGMSYHDAKGFVRNGTLAQAHFARGLYFQHLTRVLSHFPREQLLVLQYEQCVRDTAAALKDTYRFLGLDDEFVPDELETVSNPTRSAKPAVPDHIEAALVEAYAPDLAGLRAEFPEIDLGLWPTWRP